MSSTPIGNSIAVLPDGAGFDVYSASTKYPDVSPTVTILQAPAKSTDFDDTVKTSVISGGYRYSKTAANKRLADPNNPLVAVFYQDTNGYLYETFFTAAGIGAGTVHVNTVPYTGINAPFLGSSLASATFGEGSKNDILFYQASDHRIYFVLRQTYGAWSIPALVTEDPADGKTTLAALSWAEADSNSDIKVDNLCIAFTQSSDRTPSSSCKTIPTMPFGEIVVGSPGSGKSTYCYGKHQLFTALNRPISIVNLDPANDNIPYPCAIDISSLITLQDVMSEHGLGPNGGMLYCMEYLEANYDWLEERLRELGKDAYVLFDLPGQVELSTNHGSLKNIVKRLAKTGFRLAAVHLCDAHYVTDASKYVSVLLLSLRTMLHLELPHINVLSKVDLIAQYGDLDFNLDYYTEVQDLSYLETALSSASPRFQALNMAICGLIEDFSLVGFETLAVEDKNSMLHLTRAIDRATGYVYLPTPSNPTPATSHSNSHSHSNLNPNPDRDPDIIPPPTTAPLTQHPNTYSLLSSAAGPLKGKMSDVRDVQERWIDAREEWDAWERKEWRKEGEVVRREVEKAKKDGKMGQSVGGVEGAGGTQGRKLNIRERGGGGGVPS